MATWPPRAPANMQFATVLFSSRETPSLTGVPTASATSSLDNRVHGSGASPDAGVLFCAPTAHVTHIEINRIVRLVTSSSETRTSVRLPECLHATRSTSLRFRNRRNKAYVTLHEKTFHALRSALRILATRGRTGSERPIDKGAKCIIRYGIPRRVGKAEAPYPAAGRRHP